MNSNCQYTKSKYYFKITDFYGNCMCTFFPASNDTENCIDLPFFDVNELIVWLKKNKIKFYCGLDRKTRKYIYVETPDLEEEEPMKKNNNSLLKCVRCRVGCNEYYLCESNGHYDLCDDVYNNTNISHKLYFRDSKDLFTFLSKHEYKIPDGLNGNYELIISTVDRSNLDDVYIYDKLEDMFLCNKKDRYKINIFKYNNNDKMYDVNKTFKGSTKYRCVMDTINWIKKEFNNLKWQYEHDVLFDKLISGREEFIYFYNRDNGKLEFTVHPIIEI